MDGAEAPEALDEWEKIQSPFPNNYLNEDRSIFPPSHHEGLQLPLQEDLQGPEEPDPEPNSSPSSSATSSSSSNSVSDEENRRWSRLDLWLRATNEIRRRLRLPLEVLRAKVFWVASRVRNYAVCAGGFWSIASVTGVIAAVLLSFFYVRVQRWRLRVHHETKDRLVFLIKERDEMISQLLLQLSQMNELLSERRRVPVYRTS